MARELRRLHSQTAIVLLADGPVPRMTASKPGQGGQAVIRKRMDLHPRYLGDVIQAVCRGLSVVEEDMLDTGNDLLDQLSSSARAVMDLAVQGCGAPQIAEKLGMSTDSVRQHFSSAYRVLAPSAPAGSDLRTLAVLAYLELTSGEQSRWGGPLARTAPTG